MNSFDKVGAALKNGKKVSAADIASKTGLSVTTVYKNLSAMGATNEDGKYYVGGIGAAKKAKKAAPAKAKAEKETKAPKAKVAKEKAPATNPK